MLAPKKVKYRKVQKGRRRGLAYRGSTINFGQYGLMATTAGWITSRQIESARVAITRTMKRTGKLWIRIFPDKSVTKKPLETRMGKGKGEPAFWVAVVRAGRVLFEIGGVDESKAKAALRLASYKLPLRTKFISGSEVIV